MSATMVMITVMLHLQVGLGLRRTSSCPDTISSVISELNCKCKQSPIV